MGWADEPHWDDPEGQFWNPGSEPRILKVCRYCKEGKLHWVETERGWRLYDTKDNIHSCVKKREQGVKS